MDSRIKENPKRTFDLVLQVACPTSEQNDPAVLWSFPQDYKDQEVLQTVPRFCFPFDVERVSQTQVGQNFTFVLTDIDSKQRFGFCRLTQGCRVCICLLSYLPWFEIYYKLLNTLADYLTKHQEHDLNDMLNSLYDLPVPKPFTPVSLSVNEQLHIATGQVLRNPPCQEPHSYFIVPDIDGLPTIPENRNLTEYFVAVDVQNMLQLYASMLHERRIIITSSKLSTLTACVHGAAAMLFPMFWQHIFIPVLPSHLLDYCCAPMPYLVGVHLSLLEAMLSRSLEDVVILNVDTNTLETPSDDLQNLPSDVVSSLKSKLKKQSTATGSGVARAFLRAQATLFGTYRDALRYKPGEPITFCEESFIAPRSSTMRNFLEMAVNLQLFKQFIDGRLAKLNAGRGFTDVFEEEITEGGFCGSNARSYQQWMHTVKRSGALINSAVTKAKSHAKQGIRGIRVRLKKDDEDDGPSCAGSPTSTKSLSPRRLQKRRRQNLKNSPMSFGGPDFVIDDDGLDTASKISSEDSGDVPSYTEDSDDSYSLDLDTNPSQTGQMNLLEEILDSLSATTTEQGKLSTAKSLDFFRSMDNVTDCNATDKSTTANESNRSQAGTTGSGTAVGGGGGGDQGGWNRGQDDSAVHGKHLPPSPRRQPSKKSLKGASNRSAGPPGSPTPGQNRGFSHQSQPQSSPSHWNQSAPSEPPGLQEGHPVTSPSPSLPCRAQHILLPAPAGPPTTASQPSSTLTAARSRATSDPQPGAAPPSPQTHATSSSVLRRKVLSKEMARQYQDKASLKTQGGQARSRHTSMLVPWERESREEVGVGVGVVLGNDRVSEAKAQEKGLLEEIDSMCRLNSDFLSSLQLSQAHSTRNNTHRKATDQS
ncbi:DENN domain-containing protein 1B [Aplochiton taeniatus]